MTIKHRKLPNILWITLDSVRADHTSLHGYKRDTTPNLSRIAEDSGKGVNFEHGIAHSTRTPVSVPSMLTGLYPSRHQMLGMKTGAAIPPEMITAPELLSDIGYYTVGVSENGYAGVAKKIDERFDDFVKSAPSSVGDLLSPPLRRSILKYTLKAREHGPGWTLNKNAHKNYSFFTTDIIKRKLRYASQRENPFFAYIHYNDPHHPYIPPATYSNEYLDEIDATVDESLAFAQQMHDDIYQWMANGLPLSKKEWEMLYAMYDATIKYTDSMVGELFDFVQNQVGDTVVVITADHGDLFGEYGLLGHHMVLHDGLVHVPLITHGLEGVRHHANNPTQHIDVMQTLLTTVGADTTQFQGKDLREESRRVAISQDLRGTVEDDSAENYQRIRQYNSDIDLSHLPNSMVSAFRTTDYKLVKTDEWSYLYDLPNETADVSTEYPEVFRELNSFAEEWIATDGEPFEVSPTKSDLSKKTEQHLRDMGYL
ncbi:sulfatase [Halorubraceae archaeon YAN]|nr:sulfatase [Halorubraceae archaeon YAN]